MKKTLLSIVLLSTVSASYTYAEQPSFSYVEGGYSEIEEFTGFVLRGSLELTENLYFTGSHRDLTEDDSFFGDIDVTETTLGVGFKTAISSNTALFAEISYLDIELEAGPFSDSDDGHEAAIGIRSMITDKTELYGELANVEVAETSTQATLGARQYFTDNLGVFAEYSRNDFDTNSYNVGVSFKF